MKSKLSIILSIISLVGVLAVFGLWIFGSLKLSVGWQIVNAIDVREKMMQLQQRQDIVFENERRIIENGDNYIKLANNLQCGLCDSSADLYVAKGLFVEAFGCSHTALHQAILAGQPNLQNKIKKLQLLNQAINAPSVVVFSLIKKQIEAETQLIRTTDAYKQYLSTEYEQAMQVFWQKMKVLGLVE